jgi:WD40 repeat protein
LVWTIGRPGPPVVLKGQSETIGSATFSDDGRRVITTVGVRNAQIWPLEGRVPPVLLRGHADSIKSASFSPDGSKVLTSSEDGTARVWSADGREQPVVLTSPADQNIVWSATFSRDGTRVLTRTLTLSARPNDVRVWRVDAQALLAYLRESTTACLTADVRHRTLGESVAISTTLSDSVM